MVLEPAQNLHFEEEMTRKCKTFFVPNAARALLCACVRFRHEATILNWFLIYEIFILELQGTTNFGIVVVSFIGH